MSNKFINLALEQAKLAQSKGEVPIGCVIINELGEVVATGHNQTKSTHDPSAHAEIIALRQACILLKADKLHNCHLFVTIEPCPMCAAAISYARIGSIYYGAQDFKFGAIDSNVRLYNSKLAIYKPKIYSGFEAAECADLLAQYFKSKR